MKLVEYDSRKALASGLAKIVTGQLQAGTELRGFASLAVPGGSTPAPFLQSLADSALDWRNIRLTTTDERLVPLDHVRSNALLVNDNLLRHLAVKPRFLALNDPDRIRQLSQQLGKDFLPFDVCILGMGDDGHTASLFPGGDRRFLDATDVNLLARVTPPGNLEDRLSLTMHTLVPSTHIHLLIQGQAKRAVLQEAQAGDDENRMPVRALFRQAGSHLTIHFAA